VTGGQLPVGVGVGGHACRGGCSRRAVAPLASPGTQHSPVPGPAATQGAGGHSATGRATCRRLTNGQRVGGGGPHRPEGQDVLPRLVVVRRAEQLRQRGAAAGRIPHAHRVVKGGRRQATRPWGRGWGGCGRGHEGECQLDGAGQSGLEPKKRVLPPRKLGSRPRLAATSRAGQGAAGARATGRPGRAHRRAGPPAGAHRPGRSRLPGSWPRARRAAAAASRRPALARPTRRPPCRWSWSQSTAGGRAGGQRAVAEWSVCVCARACVRACRAQGCEAPPC
jgi:hypothetical protein